MQLMGTNFTTVYPSLCLVTRICVRPAFLSTAFAGGGVVVSLGCHPAQDELASERPTAAHVPASFEWKPKVADP